MSKLLPLSVATQLAHALCASLAEENGVRALSIKGPVAIEYGLRMPYHPSDADILVDPRQVDVLVDKLIENGWRKRPAEELPRVLENHSVTLIHSDWPCDLDIHKGFPGFLSDASVAFELLWKDRTTINIANRVCLAPSRAGSWTISALNHIRDGWKRDAPDISTFYVEYARHNFTAEELARIASEAQITGTMETMRSIFYELNIYQPSAYSRSPGLVSWEIRRELGLSPAVPILTAALSRDYRQFLKMIWGLIQGHLGNPSKLRLIPERIIRTIPQLGGWARTIRAILHSEKPSSATDFAQIRTAAARFDARSQGDNKGRDAHASSPNRSAAGRSTL